MNKIFIIAEIGINHNGDLEIAKEIIKGCKDAGVDAVKFQKRTINEVYSKEQLESFRESPWGTTFREQKEGIEFGESEYQQIQDCKKLKIDWYASAGMWKVKNFKKFNCKYNKNRFTS